MCYYLNVHFQGQRVNLVQFTRSNATCQCMKQAQNSSSVHKVRSDIIISIPFAPVAPFPASKPKPLFSKYILNFHLNSSSDYSHCYLYCMCDKADYVAVAAFCSLWLLL